MESQREEAQVWVEQGNQQLQWSLWSIALQSFERAITIDEDCLAAWEGKAQALRKLERWNESVEVDAKIVSLRMLGIELDEYFYGGEGDNFYHLGKYEEAIASYEKAIEFKPDYHFAWNGRGISLSALGRKEEAIAFFLWMPMYSIPGNNLTV
jgi:tetratricopeptide (TPR) repeat protein